MNIQVEYNQDMSGLEEVLASVSRPGSFCCHGETVVPLPRIEIKGMGPLAFPLLPAQAEALAERAGGAPFGRGEDTVYNEEVRKTRQLDASEIRISGAGWEKTFGDILKEVQRGLGCEVLPVRGELYKLLLYPTGGHFAAHRDTEKAEGMFGTLVISLPSDHAGGDLLVRHAGHEERISLCSTEPSALRYAAFYADCEHEVEPVTDGNRLCLVVNLILDGESPSAPVYDQEVDHAAREIRNWFPERNPSQKLVWLLEHTYTPAGLSFAALKGADAARASVLRQACEKTGCELFAGLVSITEAGPAEPDYDFYASGRRGYCEEDGEDPAGTDYEVVEVSEAWQDITDWVSPEDRKSGFDRLPLAGDELLPEGALDEEKPDEDRLTEATGNEGASFERTYRRAALVFWPKADSVRVLSGAGSKTLVKYIRMQAHPSSHPTPGLPRFVPHLIEEWPTASAPNWRREHEETGLRDLFRHLIQHQAGGLYADALSGIMIPHYEIGAWEVFKETLLQPGCTNAENLFAEWMKTNATTFSTDAIHLLNSLIECGWTFGQVLQILLDSLPAKKERPDYWGEPKQQIPDAPALAELFHVLDQAGTETQRNQLTGFLQANPTIYTLTTCVNACKELHPHRTSPGYASLWSYTASAILDRSEAPPAKPDTWTLETKPGCTCAPCKALLAFAKDPEQQTARFPLRKDLRQHIHQRIQSDDLDIDHVTERKGRPYVLVCTKNRKTHKRNVARYQSDLKHMRWLHHHAPPEMKSLVERMANVLAVHSG